MNYSDSDDDYPSPQKKKAKKKAKKLKKKQKKAAMCLAASESLSTSVDTHDSPVTKTEPDDIEQYKCVERIQIYSQPLEEVPEFNGFNDIIKTFPLCRGKRSENDDEEDDRIEGYFKGNFCLYRINEEDRKKALKRKNMGLRLKLARNLPKNHPITVIVRIYIIRANDLHPQDLNGKADPFIKIRYGKNVINDVDNHLVKQLNPIFGQCFVIEANFPTESLLTVQVMDWDLAARDDLIGQTEIDLENRFYSKHRATCGLPNKYELTGYNKWRDPLKPTQLLNQLCKESGFKPPSYSPNMVFINNKPRVYEVSQMVEDENGKTEVSNEPLALAALKHWHEIHPTGHHLVPEHIETRPLYNPEKPGVEQGKLELWIDMFPKDTPPTEPPVDISPRKPKGYELRVIVWNTEDINTVDRNIITGENSVDIYVKAWLLGEDMDKQQTDIHYRSLSGEGNFNWRYLFPFDYQKNEKVMVYEKKESFFSMEKSEIKAPPVLYIQVWDADIILSNTFIGALSLPLDRFPQGKKTSSKCKGGLKDSPMLSLFRNNQGTIKYWWPLTPGDPKMDDAGEIELELSLVTAEEAEKDPVGLGRSPPHELPEPNRPKTSFLWFTNPWKTFRYIIWRNYKWLIIKSICFILLIVIIVLFFYSMPGATVNKMFGL